METNNKGENTAMAKPPTIRFDIDLAAYALANINGRSAPNGLDRELAERQLRAMALLFPDHVIEED